LLLLLLLPAPMQHPALRPSVQWHDRVSKRCCCDKRQKATITVNSAEIVECIIQGFRKRESARSWRA
jgi:hypothetical protein